MSVITWNDVRDERGISVRHQWNAHPMKIEATNSKNVSIGPRTAPWSGGWATIRDLEVFKAVIECGTATMASSQLGISQPAVSRALSLMEERSGKKLFTHFGPSLTPTSDGLALYEELIQIFAGLERVRGLEWGGQHRPHRLRIAATPTMAQSCLNRITAQFQLQHPGSSITMEIVTTTQILEFVADGQVQLGIASVPAIGTGLKSYPFRRSRFVCALPVGHPLAQLACIKPTDLRDIPLISLVRRNDARATADRIFTKAGVIPNIVIETTTATCSLDLVAEGVGVALLNAFPIHLISNSQVIFLPFEPEMSYETAFFVPPDQVLDAFAQRYIEFVKAALPDSCGLSQAL